MFKKLLLSIIFAILAINTYATTFTITNNTGKSLPITVSNYGASLSAQQKSIASEAKYSFTVNCSKGFSGVQIFFGKQNLRFDINQATTNCNELKLLGYDATYWVCQPSKTSAYIYLNSKHPDC